MVEIEAAEITIDGDSIICIGGNTTLISNYPTGNQWLKDGWTIAAAVDQELVVTEPGFYQIQVIDPVTDVLVFSEAVEITQMVNENTIDFEADVTTIQPSETVTFRVLGGTPKSCTWNFGDMENGAMNRSTDKLSSYRYEQPGTHDDQLIIAVSYTHLRAHETSLHLV